MNCWVIEAVWTPSANKVMSPVTSVKMEGVVAETADKAKDTFKRLFNPAINHNFHIVSCKPQ